jgi:hypothetical protein
MSCSEASRAAAHRASHSVPGKFKKGIRDKEAYWYTHTHAVVQCLL